MLTNLSTQGKSKTKTTKRKNEKCDHRLCCLLMYQKNSLMNPLNTPDHREDEAPVFET